MFRCNRLLLIHLAIASFILSNNCVSQNNKTIDYSQSLNQVDQYTLSDKKHLIYGYPPIDLNGYVNVVVEIPAGTNAKWEVDKLTGNLKWELIEGKPRIVSYLPYPGNYGMIPGTLLPKELSGDGDPLDVIVLGPALPRGSIVKARIIGVLKMQDKGEQDDKIIAVLLDSPLGKITSIKNLNQQFKGISNIIETWFSNYKGPGKIKTKGYRNEVIAQNILQSAIAAYNKSVHQSK